MLGIIILIALAIFFWRAADYEELPIPFIWSAISVALVFLTPGLLPALAVQVGLFAAMGGVIYFTKWR